MPSTVVHTGFALVLAVALLGRHYDRRAIAVVLVVIVLPDLDAIAGLYVPGAHRALGHTLVLSAAVTAFVYYDTRIRELSWIASRWGDWGVRVAWVVLFVSVFAHVFLDWAHLEGVNLIYPLYDRFYRLDGDAFVSLTGGFVQTFVDLQVDLDGGTIGLDVGETGTTANTHVNNPVEPSADPDPNEPIDRLFPIAVGGWELFLVLVGLFTLVARRLQGPDPDPGEE